jgi:hypothetical protein
MTREESAGLRAQLDRALEYVSVLQKNAHLSERRLQVQQEEIDRYQDIHATIQEVQKENARLKNALDVAQKDNVILREVCSGQANSVAMADSGLGHRTQNITIPQVHTKPCMHPLLHAAA